MFTKTIKANGKFFGVVKDEAGNTLYGTPGYLTERMALADAKCWAAFNEKGKEMDPLEEARQAGLAARAKMDEENTVTVSSGTHVIPPMMAFELRKPAPHPRRLPVGTFSKAMLARQRLFKEVAELLGIPVAEAQTLPATLRAQKKYDRY